MTCLPSPPKKSRRFHYVQGGVKTTTKKADVFASFNLLATAGRWKVLSDKWELLVENFSIDFIQQASDD